MPWYRIGQWSDRRSWGFLQAGFKRDVSLSANNARRPVSRRCNGTLEAVLIRDRRPYPARLEFPIWPEPYLPALCAAVTPIFPVNFPTFRDHWRSSVLISPTRNSAAAGDA